MRPEKILINALIAFVLVLLTLIVKNSPLFLVVIGFGTWVFFHVFYIFLKDNRRDK